MSVLVLAAGCNTKDKKEEEGAPAVTASPESTEDSGSTTDSTADSTAEASEPEYLVNELVKEEYNVDDYITLGQYKGVEVNVAPAEVTEEDILFEIQSELYANGAELQEVTGRAVRLGDTVNIDYQGLKDGVAFEGGTAAGYDLMIGSGTFIPGFEEGLIGAKTGDKLDLNVTFPENYGSADLAGQPVVFKVTVNKIQEYKLTEEYVTSNTDYADIEAYKAGIKENLLADKEAARHEEIESSVYNSVREASKISSLPQTLLDFYKNDIKIYYSNVAMAYGMDFESLLSAYGVTVEQFDEDALAYAKNMAERDLVINAIIKAESLELTDEEYDNEVARVAEEYGYESTADFLAAADPNILREEIMIHKVMEFLVAEAIVK